MPDLTVAHHFAMNVPVGVQTPTGGIFMLRRRHGILPPAQPLACCRSRISTAPLSSAPVALTRSSPLE